MKKRLSKSNNKIIGGVCAGIAEYFNIDPTIVRLVVAVLCFVKGLGVLLYIIACVVMPNPDYDEDNINFENLKSANMDSDSADEKKGNQTDKVHSDEEFNKFFDK